MYLTKGWMLQVNNTETAVKDKEGGWASHVLNKGVDVTGKKITSRRPSKIKKKEGGSHS